MNELFSGDYHPNPLETSIDSVLLFETKAIVKLQQENIEGLILDLRNNGVGSLKETIDLAGIFINYGPLVITQGKTREPKSIKDFNKGAMYLGLLVILVNGLSASASEILTAALQDYNRAMVVGGRTYGKSTGQLILPLDPKYNVSIHDPDLAEDSYGSIKIVDIEEFAERSYDNMEAYLMAQEAAK